MSGQYPADPRQQAPYLSDPRASGQYPSPADLRSPPSGDDRHDYSAQDAQWAGQHSTDPRPPAPFSTDARASSQLSPPDPRSPPPRDDRNGYMGQDPPRTGQYPPDPKQQVPYSSDPRASGQYPPHPDLRSPPSGDDRNGYNSQDPPRAGQYTTEPRPPAPAPYPGDLRAPAQYPPPDLRSPPSGDDRNGYNSQDPPRTGQYTTEPRPPAPYPGDPRSYPPPASWHYPPPTHYPPPHPHYPGSAQPRHPDPYRLPPPFVHPGYGPPPSYPSPAPRQRTAIACRYCRKRKIRCSGYEASADGRCHNCERFRQECLFVPVSSQTAFVPAQAVFPGMQNLRGMPAQPNPRGDYRPQGIFSREGESPPILYGAHGIPLAPTAAPDHHPAYPPPAGYPPPNYPATPHVQGLPPSYDYRAQGPPAAQGGENPGRKRVRPDDDSPHEGGPSQSPHPTSRPRFTNELRNPTSNGYDYPDPTNIAIAPISPSTSATSHQSGYPYGGSGIPTARRHSPQSAHSYDSPRTLPIRDDGKSPPPGQSCSAPGSANGRGGMSVQAMLGDPRTAEVDTGGHRRHKDDSDMLSKLEGKK